MFFCSCSFLILTLNSYIKTQQIDVSSMPTCFQISRVKEEKRHIYQLLLHKAKRELPFFRKENRELPGRLPFTYVRTDNMINMVFSTLKSHA